MTTGWLQTITKPLGAASKTIEKLMETRDLLKYGNTFRELHRDVLSATQGALDGYARESALLQRISELEKEMTRFETWSTEKERYELRELAPHVTVYAIKETERGTEPFHYICAHCYTNGEKGFINQTIHGDYHEKFECSRCKTALQFTKRGPPRQRTTDTSWRVS